jgi:hypothetical protein
MPLGGMMDGNMKEEGGIIWVVLFPYQIHHLMMKNDQISSNMYSALFPHIDLKKEKQQNKKEFIWVEMWVGIVKKVWPKVEKSKRGREHVSPQKRGWNEKASLLHSSSSNLLVIKKENWFKVNKSQKWPKNQRSQLKR